MKKAQQTATVYNQLVNIVLPELVAYKDDLLKHDKEGLKNFTGSFLYGWRKTGTTLIKMNADYKSYKALFQSHHTDEVIENALFSEIEWLTGGLGNNSFLYFNGKELLPVTRERAIAIHRAHVTNVLINKS